MTYRLLLPVCLAAALAAASPAEELPDLDAPLKAEIAEIDSVMKASGDYRAAADAARTLLSRTEAEHGPDAYETGKVLILLVDALWRTEHVADPATLALAERAHAVLSALLESSHDDVVSALQQRAVVHSRRGQLPEALELHREVLAIARRRHGERSWRTAFAHNGVGNVLEKLGRLEEARGEYERVVEILEAEWGDQSPGIATALNNLALVLEQLAVFDEAQAMHERSLAIRRSQLGEDHPDVGQSLDNLGTLHAVRGDLPLALDLWGRARDVYEVALGPDHPELAMILNNQAIVHAELGDLLASRRALEEALEIRRSALGEEHPDVAESLYNLAADLVEIGDHAEAAPLIARAVSIQRRLLGTAHPAFGRSVRLEARLHLASGRDAIAVHVAEAARTTLAAALGDAHPEVAACLDVIGDAELAAGDHEAAAARYQLAWTMRRDAFGETHPSIAESLERLGRVALAAGASADAIARFEEAITIRQALLGPEHPAIARARVGKALALEALGRSDEALTEALEAEALRRRHVRDTARGLPERQAVRHTSSGVSGLDLAMRMLARTPGLTFRADAVWDALVRSRALVLDEMAARRRTFAALALGEHGELADSLADARRRLAGLTLRATPEDPVTYRRRLAETRREKEALERRVAEITTAGSLERQTVSLGEVLSTLEETVTLIEYARWEDGNGSGYLAFVAAPGREVALARLGEAEGIDRTVASWHERNAPRVGRGFSVRTLPLRSGDGAGRDVAERIWEPIAPLIGDAELLLVVPDGAVNAVNLDALPGSSGPLARTIPPIHLLSATRDVVRLGAPRDRGEGMLLVGDPDFDAHPDAPLVAALRGGVDGDGGGCVVGGDLVFAPLENARGETEAIARAWVRSGAPGRLHRLTGAAATESAVKNGVAGMRVVHLATHGFVAGEGCDAPLARSGLALAGANGRADRDPEREEDGMLTAEEIASLDLGGAEWVVLSACETGRGGVVPGEGILGLRRAFEIAGAGTLVTSLWGVGDAATREWMTELYARRLAGASTPEAVRGANLAMLDRAGPDAPPGIWAAFVASGEWR